MTTCSSDHEKNDSSLFCPECLSEIAWQCSNGHIVELKLTACTTCGAQRTFMFSEENLTEIVTISESPDLSKRELIPDVIRLKKFRKRRKIFLGIFFLLIILFATASSFGVFQATNVKVVSKVESLTVRQPNNRLYANVSVKVHKWSTTSRLICHLFIPSSHYTDEFRRINRLKNGEKFDLGTFEIKKILTNSPVLIEVATDMRRTNVTYLGVEFETKPSIQQQNKNSKSGALVVKNVKPGTPASSAGLLQGDIIDGIDGKKVSREEDLTAVKSSHLPGDVITISIIRGSNHQAIKLTLGTDRSKGGWLDPSIYELSCKAP
jgi:uncharacterized membrane protein YvbJ